jgi:hypothetical protein
VTLRLLDEGRISRPNVAKRRPSVGSRPWDLTIPNVLRGRPAVAGSCLEVFGNLLVGRG